MTTSTAYCAVLLVTLLCSFLSPTRRGAGRRVGVVLGAILAGSSAAWLLNGAPLGITIAAAFGALFAHLGPSPRSGQARFGFGRSFARSSLRPGLRRVTGRW